MTDRLRDALVAAVNGNPVSVDDAWALIHAWDKQVWYAAECERLRAENEHLREQLKEESALKWSARKARQAGEADDD
jgi:regulator of replication initiation timing